MEKSFSPKQVADALRVSESSIKRWCDRGAIQTVKTLGGHRRIPLDGLLTFLEATNREIANHGAIGIAPSSSSDSGSAEGGLRKRLDDETLRQYFEDALIRGDEKECRRILIEYFDRYENFSLVADHLIAFTFRRVGELWHRGDVEVFQERRGCEICTRLLHEFRRLFPEPSNSAPLAIGATSSGDNYALPGRCVEVVLREIGWRSMNLGTNLPFETLIEAVRAERPKMIWLSVSHLQEKDKFVEDYAKFWEALPEEMIVVLGGRELTDDFRPKLKYTVHCDTMQQLSMFARSLRAPTLIKNHSPI